MELIEAIEKRRSIRSFKNDDISDEVVKEILNSGRLAPSAKNRQPWYFVILKNEIKDKVADLMIDFHTKDNGVEECQKQNTYSSLVPTAKAIKESPVLVVIFRPKDDMWITSDNLSIGACVENMCLRALDHDLGTLWIRDIVYVSKTVAEMLGHSDLELNCAVSIGVPNQNPVQRPRKELDEIIEWF